LEDRIFSLKTPSSFFTFFGSLGGAAAGDLAIEAFEDDVKVVGRTVSGRKSLESWRIF
jgi:syntaxin-binding protein 1